MKNPVLFLFLAIAIAFINCSDDDGEDNTDLDPIDPIVGTWAIETTRVDRSGAVVYVTRDEWKFEANNTGMVTDMEDGEIFRTSSFTWNRDGDEYYVVYALEDLLSDTYTVGEINGVQALFREGLAFAFRD